MSQTKVELLADSFGTSATGTIPVGGIIMWSGTIASIPTGWNLCDGNDGTPDLRNKFILGAFSDGSGSTYPNVSTGATGGSANAVLISHTHTQVGGGTDDDGGNRVPGSQSGGTLSNISTSGLDVNGNPTSSQTGTNANLPPYYALAYIMRVS